MIVPTAWVRLALACAVGSGGGCGALRDWACDDEPCEGGWTPATGSQAAFTLSGEHDPDAVASAPQPCESEYGGDVSVVQVTAGGATEIEAETWITDRLMPELLARGLRLPARTLGECTDPDDVELDYTLAITDWSDADPLVGLVLELARLDDVSVDLTVGVEALPLACADDTCGA